MWQEQLDVFWDGERSMLFGFFESGGEIAGPKAASPDLTIISSNSPDFSGETFFVDRLDATRWRAGACLVDVASGHKHLLLLASDGSEAKLSLEETEGDDLGEWRLALTVLPEGAINEPPVVRKVTCSARSDFQRFARDQFSLAGARLAWACGYRRLLARGEGGTQFLRIWPASQLFPPMRVRLAVEGADYPPDGFEDRREAPFAIMEQWLREGGAPRPLLRIRLFEPLEEIAHVLGRISLALVMHQRRRMRDWTREQQDAGEPVIAPLSIEDIRQATGQLEECPDAVWTHEPIVVYNLLKLATAPEDVPLDGLTIRRSTPNGTINAGSAAASIGTTLELDFYGAALGDDITLISLNGEAGEAWTLSRIAGNAPNIRLFRVEAEGVRPRKLAEDDPLAAEILRTASHDENALAASTSRAMLERAAGLQARREKAAHLLNAALARLDDASGFDSFTPWEPLSPLLLLNFLALLREAEPAGRALAARLGGYRSYRLTPSLFAALVLHPRWGGDLADGLGSQAHAPLTYRFARLCDAENLLPPRASVAEQAHAFSRLLETSDPQRLRAARLTLDNQGNADPLTVADELADLRALEEAAAFYERQGDAQSAQDFRGYIRARNAGDFVSLTKATALAALLAHFRDAKAESARIKTQEPPAPEPEPPKPKPKGLLAAMRGLFGGGR